METLSGCLANSTAVTNCYGAKQIVFEMVSMETPTMVYNKYQSLWAKTNYSRTNFHGNCFHSDYKSFIHKDIRVGPSGPTATELNISRCNKVFIKSVCIITVHSQSPVQLA